jgi:hypothetical protein
VGDGQGCSRAGLNGVRDGTQIHVIKVFGCEEGKRWSCEKSCKLERIQSDTLPVIGPVFPALMLYGKWPIIVMTKHMLRRVLFPRHTEINVSDQV